jgi:hypothetical protein
MGLPEENVITALNTLYPDGIDEEQLLDIENKDIGEIISWPGIFD